MRQSARLLSHLFSIPEVAEALGVSSRTVRRFIDQKLINYVRVGNQYRFRPEAVDLFLSQREVKAKVAR